MNLTLSSLENSVRCPECRGVGEVDSPEVESANYWVGVNMGSYNGAIRLARESGNLTVPCPCCKGQKTIAFTVMSSRLEGILNQICSDKVVEIERAPTSLAGEDWWYIQAHPDIVKRKMGFSSDYLLYHKNSTAAQRARSFF